MADRGGERQRAPRQTFSQQTTPAVTCAARWPRRCRSRVAAGRSASGFGNYVWKRLRIIASEDVGLTLTETVIAVRALYENWNELRKTVKPPYEGFVRIFLLHAAVLLARAPKSRMLDHALIAMYAGERPRFEVPDHALDRHTERGRRMGRGYDHFLAEGAQLANEAGGRPVPGRGARGAAPARRAAAAAGRAARALTHTSPMAVIQKRGPLWAEAAEGGGIRPRR
jgi:MgsA AAA+ ATPase C terminal